LPIPIARDTFVLAGQPLARRKSKMKFITDPKKSFKPAPYYAQMATILRERGLEVQDDDCDLIDLTIQECDRLLSLRSFLSA
jgi:hypothetical protein